MSALAVSIDQFELMDRIAPAIQRAGSDKNVARMVNSNPRTVSNWKQRRSVPDALHLLRLMQTVPEVQAEVRRLTGMITDIDPHFERDLIRLMQTYSKLRGDQNETPAATPGDRNAAVSSLPGGAASPQSGDMD